MCGDGRIVDCATGVPVLYLTGSLKRAAAKLGVKGSAFVLYFALTAALMLLPVISVSYAFSICLAGIFYCFAPVAILIRQR